MLNTFSLRIDPIYSISNISAILGACLSWGILEKNAMNAAKAWMEAGLSCQIDMVVYSCWTSVRAMVEIIWESIKPFTFLPTLLPSLFHTGLRSEEALAECNAFSSRMTSRHLIWPIFGLLNECSLFIQTMLRIKNPQTKTSSRR